MGVVDFDNCELLEDSVVEAKFLLFENRDHLFTQVNGEEVNEEFGGCNFAVGRLDFVGHATCIG